MIGSINTKVIMTDEPLLRAGEPAPVMTFGRAGRTISVPARIEGPDAAGRMNFAPENAQLTTNVIGVLRAMEAGLRITMIAAADEDWGIGVEGRLPWRNANDLRHFRQRTLGRHLLMGRTTFEGLPTMLDGRTIHVLSRSGPEHLTSVDRALHSLLHAVQDEIVVAGGGQVYEQALAFCTHAEITRIRGTHGCDTFMPNLRAAGWILASTEAIADDINIEHWERKK
jgi:dihydrofolate reductase